MSGGTVQLDASALEELPARLARRRGAGDAGDGWELGTPHRWLHELLEAWGSFDSRTFQRRLEAGPHRFIGVGGRRIHLLEVPGSGPDPLPLVLTHGWPGSFLEYTDLIPRLVDPAAHGADPSDAFTVVVPSLPGFGFSDPPRPPGLTARDIAAVWNELMVTLGHRRYVAHGSDLGAGVTAWLGRDHGSAVAAIHLATPGLAVSSPRTEAEERFAAAVGDWTAQEGGYLHEHATKPLTLAAGLADSPAGLAAWIGEKVEAWSSLNPDGSSTFPRERLLETLTLYWATNTIATSLLPYWTYAHRPETRLPIDAPSPTPTAVSIFGGERVSFPKPPRSLAERFYTISHWIEHDRGGHFPAVAEPELLATDIRRAFADVR